MKLAIFQPYFFPYLGYFQLISAVDKFLLYDHLNYIQKGWMNRNRLLIVNEQPVYFGAPIKAHHRDIKICNIVINNKFLWYRTTIKQLEMNYRKAPYFDEVIPLVEKALTGQEDHLAILNNLTIRAVCEFLEIPTEIVTAGAQYEAMEIELSKSNSELIAFYWRQQQLTDVKTMRILEICRQERAETYINAIGGRDLYDKHIFAQGGVDLYFIQSLPYSYQQRSTEFFAGLSILDVMMNCGKAGTQRLLMSYELI